MSNTGCLEGVECPRCGNDEELRVAAMIWIDVTDDGSVPSEAPGRTDHEWDHDAITECPRCGYTSRFRAFLTYGGHRRS